MRVAIETVGDEPTAGNVTCIAAGWQARRTPVRSLTWKPEGFHRPLDYAVVAVVSLAL